MLTSGDIAQGFAAQQAMFMGQNTFAQNIGFSYPGTGLESSGFPRRPGHAGPPMPGMHAGPAPFSYAPSGPFGMSYGPGNRHAGNFISGAGAVATLGATMMFDPFSAFLGGAARYGSLGSIRGIAAGFGGGMAAAMPPALGAYAASQAIGAVVHGAQYQAQTNTALGTNFGFLNPMSRTGFGFNRTDAQGIGEQIRHLAHIPELMTSVQELNSLMPLLKRTGAMQGVKDAAEFNRRFKEAVSTIRDVSKVLGSTMEEAAEFFAQSRNLGFFGKKDQLRHLINNQYSSASTGLSMGQVGALSQGAGDLARSFGASHTSGVRGFEDLFTRFSVGVANKNIPESLIQAVAGSTGPEGRAEAMQRVHQGLLNMSRSPLGIQLAVGATKEVNGELQFDQDVIEGLNSGRLDPQAVMDRAGLVDPSKRLRFVQSLPEVFARSPGLFNYSAITNTIAKRQGLPGGEDANNELMKKWGVDNYNVIRLIEAMDTVSDADVRSSLTSAANTAGRNAFLSNQSPQAMWERMVTRLEGALLGGAKALGAAALGNVARSIDDFQDDVAGNYQVFTTPDAQGRFVRGLMSGDTLEAERMSAMARNFVQSERSGFGRTISSWFNETVLGQNNFAQRFYGVGNDRMTEMARRTAAGDFSAGADPEVLADMQMLRAGIRDYADMSSTQRVEAVMGAVHGVLGAAPTNLRRMFEEGTWVKNPAAYEAMVRQQLLGSGSSETQQRAGRFILAGMQARQRGFTGLGQSSVLAGTAVPGTISSNDLSQLANVDSLNTFLDVRRTSDAIKDAEQGLRALKIGDSTISFLSSNADFRTQVLGGSTMGGLPALATLLDKPSSEGAVLLSAKLGRTVSEEEFVLWREHAGALLHRGKGPGRTDEDFTNVDNALRRYDRTRQGGNFGIFARALKKMGTSLQGLSLGGANRDELGSIVGALQNFGADGKPSIVAGYDALHRLGLLYARSSSADRSAIEGATGEYGVGLRHLQRFDSSKSYNLDSLMQSLNLSGAETLTAIQKASSLSSAPGSGRQLTQDQVAQVLAVASKFHGIGSLLQGNPALHAREEEMELKDVLRDLRKALDFNSTVHAKANKLDDLLKNRPNDYSEQARSGANGKAAPGGK